MKILSLNIRHGGGTRVDRLCAAIAALEATVVVLQEFRTNESGNTLCANLKSQGFAYTAHSEPGTHEYGVLIASRERFTNAATMPVIGNDRCRVLEVGIGSLRLGGVYFPVGRATTTFWTDHFLPLARQRKGERYIFAGDFNSCSKAAGDGARDYSADALKALLADGWTDAWRAKAPPDASEFTWQGRVNGYRLDYAFVSPALAPSLKAASHSHDERTSRATDHSGLLISIDA
jgi:exodeoxyribonuclease-3